MRPTAGGPWPGPLRNANTIARIMEATDYYFREIASGKADRRSGSQTPFGVVKIKNGSNAARRKGEILQLGAYSLTDLTRHLSWHNATLPDGTDAPFVVLLEAMQDGDIGPAQILGPCIALVNITHASQRYARPKKDEDVLQGGALGQVRILHQPSGAGEKECEVLLGDGRFEAIGESDEPIAAGTTPGTVNILTGAGGAETDSGMDEECFVLGADGAPDATKGGIALINNVLYFTPNEGCA